MMRKLLILGVAFVMFAAGAAAAAVKPWRVVARASATGSYAVANASASVQNPEGLAVRSTAGAADINWSIVCSGEVKAAVNRVYVLSVLAAKDCNLSALGSADGRVTVQLLRR